MGGLGKNICNKNSSCSFLIHFHPKQPIPTISSSSNLPFPLLRSSSSSRLSFNDFKSIGDIEAFTTTYTHNDSRLHLTARCIFCILIHQLRLFYNIGFWFRILLYWIMFFVTSSFFINFFGNMFPLHTA